MDTPKKETIYKSTTQGATTAPINKEVDRGGLDSILKDVRNLRHAYLDTSKDGQRQRIADRFVNWYFYTLTLAVVSIVLYDLILAFYFVGWHIDKLDILKQYYISLQDAILTVAGLTGGNLGFILGYYFKSGD